MRRENLAGVNQYADRVRARRQHDVTFILSSYTLALQRFTQQHGIPEWADICITGELFGDALVPMVRTGKRSASCRLFKPDLTLDEQILAVPDGNKETLDWESLRPVLAYLYIRKNWKLSDIRRIVAEKYGHLATEQMYKKRFAKWGLRKYYTHKQKRQMLSELFRSAQFSLSNNMPTVNGQPLKIGRLRRPVYQNGQMVRLSPAISGPAPNSLPTRDEPSRHQSSPRQQQLGASPTFLSHDNLYPKSLGGAQVDDTLTSPSIGLRDSCNTELFFHQMSCYYNWYCSQWNSSPCFSYSPSLANVFETLRTGRQMLAESRQRSFGWFNAASANVKDMLLEQPYQLLNQLMVEFYNPAWTEHPMIKSAMLGFIACMAKQTFGDMHPLTTAICLLKEEALLSHVTPTAIGVAVSLVHEHRGERTLETWRTKIECINSLLEIRNDAAAERQCLRLISQTRRLYHRDSWIERLALEKLAWMRFRQEQYEEAELLCLEVLQRSVQEYGASVLRATGGEACQLLGQLCLNRNDYAGAEIWHAFCVRGALQRSDDPTLFRHIETLESTLELQGKVEEVGKLRRDLEEVYTKWKDVDSGLHTTNYAKDLVKCGHCLSKKHYTASITLPCLCLFCIDCINTIWKTYLKSDQLHLAKCRCLSRLPLPSIEPFFTPETQAMHAERYPEVHIPIDERVYCGDVRCSVWIPPHQIRHDTSTAWCPTCSQATCVYCKHPKNEHLTNADGQCVDDPNREIRQCLQENGFRPCSACHIPIEKIEGCDRMECRCGCNFCYICGTVCSNRKLVCGCDKRHDPGEHEDGREEELEREERDDVNNEGAGDHQSGPEDYFLVELGMDWE